MRGIVPAWCGCIGDHGIYTLCTMCYGSKVTHPSPWTGLTREQASTRWTLRDFTYTAQAREEMAVLGLEDN